MEVGSKVKSYFTDLREDIAFLKINRDEDRAIRKARISSVALRVLGGLVALMTVSPALSTIVAFVTHPFSVLGLLAVTIMGMVIAHDLFKTGKNIRNLLATCQGLEGHWARFATTVVQLVKVSLEERQNGAPYQYNGTYLFQRVYRWTHRANQAAAATA